MQVGKHFLNLTQQQVNDVVTTDTSVRIDAKLDAWDFHAAFARQIRSSELTPEKAVYASLHVRQRPLRSIPVLLANY